MTDEATPKVFVSYSWTSDEHVEWVVALAERLVADGVDVVIDQWDFKEGHDKYAFMERMVTDKSVKKVLAVCDKRYADKADGRDGGVGTESQIISAEVYNKVNQEKFIPLLRERDERGVEVVPTYFKGKRYIDFSNDATFEEAYEQLVRNLFDKPARKKPPLGKPPAHLLIEGAPTLLPAAKLDRLRAAVAKDSPYTFGMLQEYLDTFLDCMEQFRVAVSADDENFDDAVIQSVASFLAFRDSFVDMIAFVGQYMNTDECHERIGEFFDSLLVFQNRPAEVGRWSEEQFDNYRFILYELFLYTIAALIRVRAVEFAGFLIRREYCYADSVGGSKFLREGASAFNNSARSFGHGKIKGVADFVSERATSPRIRRTDLIQADILLCIYGYLPGTKYGVAWFPRCAIMSQVNELELFAKATTEPGLMKLKALLNVESLADLSAKLQTLLKMPDFIRLLSQGGLWRMPIKLLLNADEILAAARRQ
jgi:hypothetical protein